MQIQHDLPKSMKKFSLLSVGVKVAAALSASVCLVAAANPVLPTSPKPELVFTSWGGSYAQAQAKVVVAPFVASTGIPVRMAEYNGGIEQLRKQKAAGNLEWDVVDMLPSDALKACSEGLLEKINPDMLPPGVNGERPLQDFIPGALADCFVGTNVWSTVFTFSKSKFPDQAPKSVADIFDLNKFPGKRALQKSPQGNLEWALMADGVPNESIYAVLGTPEGLARAFRKLDTIKRQVVWWESGSKPIELLLNGEVAIASAYNGRAYAEVIKSRAPIRFMWDGQLLSIDGIAIVKGTPNLAAAQALVKHAAQPSVMVALAPSTGYGPTRVSATKTIDVILANMLPTAHWYQKRSLKVDMHWWAKNGENMNKQFEAWLAK